MRADQIHDGPLDGTRLSADITRDFPGLHQSIRYAEWRADLKRRVRERRSHSRALKRCPRCSSDDRTDRRVLWHDPPQPEVLCDDLWHHGNPEEGATDEQ